MTKPMKIGIIGAGFTGLAAAYELSKMGHQVIVLEKSAYPGGLGTGFFEQDWEWPLDCYYHHLFSNDRAMIQLAKELKHPLLKKFPRTSVWMNNQSYLLDDVYSIFKLPDIKLSERIHMLLGLACLRFNPFWKQLENFSAHTSLPALIGNGLYKKLWEPLLIKKFHDHYKEVSLAWFWARIYKRTKKLLYPSGGFLGLAQQIASSATRLGTNFHFDFSVNSIVKHGDKFSINEQENEFDKVLVTLPPIKLFELCSQFPPSFQKKLQTIPSMLGAMVLILRLRKPFLANQHYWLNYCDKNFPLLGIIEHTHFVEKQFYNNEHIVYLAHYLPASHPWFNFSAEELRSELDVILQSISPGYDKQLIASRLFKTAYAQPVIHRHYSKTLLPLHTPLANLYCANQQQIYPWDRGTNYAVELGQRVARLMVK